MTAGFLFEAKNPYFRWKNRFSSDIDMDTGNENLTPEFFVTSDVSLTNESHYMQCSSLIAR
jgi:hypothetical protein